MKAVIIEDELPLRETNRILLTHNFPDIEIVGEAATVADAVKTIKTTQPDLVLLDIELMDGNCFQVLQQCKPYTFKPIFITAHSEYAIKAIKFSAIDYIMKPVNEYEFCHAIEQAITNINQRQEQLVHFEQHYSDKTTPRKIIFRTTEDIHIVNIADIVYCKSDNSYTTIFLTGGQQIMVSKSMKEHAELLEEYQFLKPHQSFLVNLNHIAKIDKTDGGFVIMDNGDEIPISARRKQVILDRLEGLL